jgi:hypothetical protein
MFEYAWVRWIVASLLFGAWGATNGISWLLAGASRPPRVWRPLWSHLLGFIAVLAFYGLAGADGRAIADGAGNTLGVALAGVAMIARFGTRRSIAPGRHPDLVTRLLFYAALALVIGSPRSLLAFVAPQALIAVYEAARREQIWRVGRIAGGPVA